MESQWSHTGLQGSAAKIGISAALLLIFFLSFQYVIGTLAAVMAFILGASFRLYTTESEKKPKDDVKKERVQVLHQLASYYKKLIDLSKDEQGRESPSPYVKPQRNKMDMRITGSAIIDETIHEMIDYILRDYVHSWYDFISDDDEFIHELRKTIQETLVNLSCRVKEVDWIPFLTTELVDDAASHLRLYRSAISKVKQNPQYDVISVFFDFEASMERKFCRDMVCTDDAHLQDYLQGLSEALLYLLIPQNTFHCTPAGSVAQDLLVNYVFLPIIKLFSDPDVVNQYIIWLCQSFTVSPEILLSTIQTCDNIDEVSTVQFFFTQQIEATRDAIEATKIPEEKSSLREQLKSLNIIKTIVDKKLSRLKEGTQGDWTDEGDQWQNYFMSPGMKLHSLTLDEVLRNSVALSYFIDFMNSVNGNHYILLYLNADAWKATAEQQRFMLEQNDKKEMTTEQKENNQVILECVRSAAVNIFEQFLSETAVPRVKLPENVLKRFYVQVRTDSTINLSLFDEIQESLVELMRTTEKFYPSFLRHKLYVKCLLEIDLLKSDSVTACGSDEEEDDTISVEELDLSESASLHGVSTSTGASNPSKESSIASLYVEPSKHEYQMCRDCLKKELTVGSVTPLEALDWEKYLLSKKYKLNAEIIEAGLASEKGKQYGVYAVQVTRLDDDEKEQRVWHLYRRYSDFHDFHQWMKSKWAMISRIEFPGKHTFRTTDRMLLEKRKIALNKYMCSVLTMSMDPCFGDSIQDALLHFLEPGNYTIKKKQLTEKIETLVNPLKLSVKSVTDAVKSVPDTFISTVDGFAKIFNTKTPESASFIEANKVGASLDEADDNIPLRIILLLMDELFDLKSRNQWLRRRIVAIIRQVLKAMLGDTINRRIVDYVAYLTCPARVSGYLKNLQKSLWPGGSQMSARMSRDTETKMRARFSAKLSLLASLSNELKHLIGSETTRRGLLCVFDLCQDPVLNRRFVLVLFEGILKTLFPDKPFPTIIQRLHYRSNRVSKHRPFLITSVNTASSSTSSLTRSASSVGSSSAGGASNNSSSSSGSATTSTLNASPRSSRKKK